MITDNQLRFFNATTNEVILYNVDDKDAQPKVLVENTVLVRFISNAYFSLFTETN